MYFDCKYKRLMRLHLLNFFIRHQNLFLGLPLYLLCKIYLLGENRMLLISICTMTRAMVLSSSSSVFTFVYSTTLTRRQVAFISLIISRSSSRVPSFPSMLFPEIRFGLLCRGFKFAEYVLEPKDHSGMSRLCRRFCLMIKTKLLSSSSNLKVTST